MGGQSISPAGRCEKRVAKKEEVELLYPAESPTSKVKAITKNVSSQGARVITETTCIPGKLVRLEAPHQDMKLPARIVYCQRLDKGNFAVGLQFLVSAEG